MQHPIEATIAWSILLIAVFAPLAVRLYQRGPPRERTARCRGDPAPPPGAGLRRGGRRRCVRRSDRARRAREPRLGERCRRPHRARSVTNTGSTAGSRRVRSTHSRRRVRAASASPCSRSVIVGAACSRRIVQIRRSVSALPQLSSAQRPAAPVAVHPSLASRDPRAALAVVSRSWSPRPPRRAPKEFACDPRALPGPPSSSRSRPTGAEHRPPASVSIRSASIPASTVDVPLVRWPGPGRRAWSSSTATPRACSSSASAAPAPAAVERARGLGPGAACATGARGPGDHGGPARRRLLHRSAPGSARAPHLPRPDDHACRTPHARWSWPACSNGSARSSSDDEILASVRRSTASAPTPRR